MTLAVVLIDVGAFPDQQVDNGKAAASHRPVQCRATLGVDGIGGRTLGDEGMGDLRAALLDRLNEVAFQGEAARIPAADGSVDEAEPVTFRHHLLQHRVIGLRQRIDEMRSTAILQRHSLRGFQYVEAENRTAVW